MLSVTEPPCHLANLDVGYNNDTDGGSSGAPVIAVSSQKVIALHHCRGLAENCGDPNTGVPIDQICADIGGNFCNSCTVTNELVGSTCHDGIDNDCDGYTDCEDSNCYFDEANCFCVDINGNSPPLCVNCQVVCVDWAAAGPPVRDLNFALDLTNLGSPGVTFRTGNDGWKVWSQQSVEDDAPANLGHIKIDPNLLIEPHEDFSVIVAHAALPGANYIASMSLVKTGWTGTSNLSGGSIAWDLEGDIVLQGTAGVSEAATFIIGGGVNGDVIDIPTVNTLEVKDGVSANTTIIVGGFAGGHRRVKLNTRSGTFDGTLSLPNGAPDGASIEFYQLFRGLVDFDGNGLAGQQELAGKLKLFAGSAEESAIHIGQLASTGFLSMEGPLPLTYFGDVTLNSIESGGDISIYGPAVTGSINVIEDWKGVLVSEGKFSAGGLISIGGSLSDTGSLHFRGTLGATSGDIVIEQNCEGRVEINGNMAGDIFFGRMASGAPLIVSGGMSGDIIVAHDSNGYVNIGGNITGNVNIGGVLNGDLHANNLSASAALPSNVSIGCGIGTYGTISGEYPVCPPGNLDTSAAQPRNGTKDARQPYPVGAEGTAVPLSARQGIGSPNADARDEDKIFMTLDNQEARAIYHGCWVLCETEIEPTDTGTSVEANKIACIAETTDASASKYQVKLERPISAKQWTTIRYSQGNSKVSYASLPGNINGDNWTNSTDLFWHIDCINGITSHCGGMGFGTPGGPLVNPIYRQDLDHSGLFVVGADFAYTWVDLWNGAGNFISWSGKSLPSNSCPVGSGGGGAMSMAMAGGGGEEGLSEEMLVTELVEEEPTPAELNAEFADWLVNFLVEADPHDSEARGIFDESVGMITQWCLEQFSTEEKSALVQRLTAPELTFASEIGASGAATLSLALVP